MERVLKHALVLAAIVAAGVTTAASAQSRSFAWYGELVSSDAAGKTVTVTAQVLPHVAGYLNRFKAGDSVVLLWNGDGARGGDADSVAVIATPDEMKIVDVGYITRVVFVSGDAASRTVTFRIAAPDTVLKTAGSAQAGRWIKVTAPMDQPGPATVLTSALATDKPLPRVKAAPAVPAKPPVVVARGGISGPWTLTLTIAGMAINTECELAQDGPKLGGVCKSSAGDAPVGGSVTGTKVEIQYLATFFGMEVEFSYSGAIEAGGTKMSGTIGLFGMEASFTGVKK